MKANETIIPAKTVASEVAADFSLRFHKTQAKACGYCLINLKKID